MRIWIVSICLLLVPGGIAREPLTTNELTRALLLEEISAHISQPRFDGALWGVKVVSLQSGETLFETNAQKLLKPASNAKLFTGALALDRFGPDFKIKTSILVESEPDADGVLAGDLIIYGRGDYSMAARFYDGDYTNILKPLVEAIQATKIKVIEGDLIGDETYFRGPRMGSSWAWDDLQYYYGAEVSALTLQDNVIDLEIKPGMALQSPCSIILKPQTEFVDFINRTQTIATNGRTNISIFRPVAENIVYITGTLPLNHGTWDDAATVSKPALWFITMLKERLMAEGIEVKGELVTRSWPGESPRRIESYKELGFVESRPFPDLLAKMMKPSQNLYAQLLLLQVGAHSIEATNQNRLTEDLGLIEMRRFLRKADVNPNEVLLDEGSGLSRSALVTPNAIVQLLRFMQQHEHAGIFHASLPEAGTDGTLRNRLTDLKGNLFAKTGTIRYVNSLSGYMKSKAGEPLVFSIILNAYNNQGSASSRDEIDAIPLMLAKLNELTTSKTPEP